MNQPCPACGAPSSAFSSYRNGSDRTGEMIIIRLRCERAHDWQIKIHEDLYAMRRARRYDQHSARLRLLGTRAGQTPVEDAKQLRVQGTPAVMRHLADTRSTRGWWE